MAGLTDRQERFIQERLKGKSQRQAYYAAYPRSKNWSDNAVDREACVLAKKPKVAQRYNELHDAMVEEAIAEGIVTGKDIIRELAHVGFAKATDFVQIENENVIIKDTGKIALHKQAAIAGIKEGANGIEIKLHDKVKALGKLSDIMGISEAAEDTQDDGFIEALKGEAADIWADEE